MSATINPALFANYFGGCPVISVPGRLFPVTEYFLEDVFELTGHRLEVQGLLTLEMDSEYVRQPDGEVGHSGDLQIKGEDAV